MHKGTLELFSNLWNIFFSSKNLPKNRTTFRSQQKNGTPQPKILSIHEKRFFLRGHKKEGCPNVRTVHLKRRFSK
jgi:hypothetical protein